MANQLNILEIQEIMALLPHRYPFLMIDRVLDFTPGESLTAIKNVTINEPILPAISHYANFSWGINTGSFGSGHWHFRFKTVTERSENELYLFAAIDEARFKNLLFLAIKWCLK